MSSWQDQLTGTALTGSASGSLSSTGILNCTNPWAPPPYYGTSYTSCTHFGDLVVKQVANGFIVEAGHAKFVFQNVMQMAKWLEKHFEKPQK